MLLGSGSPAWGDESHQERTHRIRDETRKLGATVSAFRSVHLSVWRDESVASF